MPMTQRCPRHRLPPHAALCWPRPMPATPLCRPRPVPATPPCRPRPHAGHAQYSGHRCSHAAQCTVHVHIYPRVSSVSQGPVICSWPPRLFRHLWCITILPPFFSSKALILLKDPSPLSCEASPKLGFSSISSPPDSGNRESPGPGKGASNVSQPADVGGGGDN